MEEITQMMKTAEETLDDLLGNSDRSLFDTTTAADTTTTTTTPNRDFIMKKEDECTATTPGTLVTTATADLSMISTESIPSPAATDRHQTPTKMVTDDDKDNHYQDTVMMTDDEEKELVEAATPSNNNLAYPPKPVRKAGFQTFNPPASQPPHLQSVAQPQSSSNNIRRENPLSVFRKAVEKSKSKQSSQQQSSSYRERRRELTVPLDVPIASRTTASWSGKTGSNTSAVPSFPYKLRKPSIVSPPPSANRINRKRKLTIPLDVPLAKRPTLSWLGRHGKDDSCQRNERNMNKSRRKVDGNYLPSIGSRPSYVANFIISNDKTAESVVSNKVFPEQIHYHKHTVPGVVTIADKPTASWDNRGDGYYNVPENYNEECLPYMKTPNGQHFIRGRR